MLPLLRGERPIVLLLLFVVVVVLLLLFDEVVVMNTVWLTGVHTGIGEVVDEVDLQTCCCCY